MSRTRRWSFRALALLLGLSVVAAGVEGISAVILHYEKEANESVVHPLHLRGQVAFHGLEVYPRADPYLLFRMAPNHRGRRVQTNQHGLRNGDITPLPAPGTVRILLLGGSVAWGFNSLSNDDTIAAYLEDLLNLRFSDPPDLRFEVLNGAAPGYVAWQESLIYALHYRELGAQIVITLDGVNEVAAGLTASAAGYPLGYDAASVSHRRPRLSLAKVISEWIMWRLHRSKTHQLINDGELPRLGITKLIRRVRHESVEEIQPPSSDQLAQAYSLSLQHLVDVAGFDQRFAIAVLQPLLILNDSKVRTEFEETISREFETKMPGATQYYSDAFEGLRAVLIELQSSNSNFRGMDSSLLFREETADVFVDYCHLTPRGRKGVAQVLADAISELPLAARGESRLSVSHGQ